MGDPLNQHLVSKMLYSRRLGEVANKKSIRFPLPPNVDISNITKQSSFSG
jgi:hypothetical protein